MATLEERVQALEREYERLQVLEQEHTQLKKTIELQTIAIRALVSKEAFEKLQDTIEKSQEQNGRTFDALIAHDRLTNEQLAELRTQRIQLDGKIVGLQTEMRQRFNEQDGRIAEHTTMLQQHTGLLQEILKLLPEN